MKQFKIELEKAEEHSKFWLVVWNKVTGDFRNAKINANLNEDTDQVSEKFENAYPDYRVIHIGEGEQPPKTYRSLEYVS